MVKYHVYYLNNNKHDFDRFQGVPQVILIITEYRVPLRGNCRMGHCGVLSAFDNPVCSCSDLVYSAIYNTGIAGLAVWVPR